jgi:type III secretion protein C
MRFITSLVTAAILAAATAPASLAAGAWSDKKFVYRAEGKKLPEVFQDFAASQSIPVVVDPSVEGVVNASFDGLPENFLKAMSKTYGVIWYFDGISLFVYPSKAMQSQVFRLRGYDRAQVRQMLASFGMGDSRFPLRYNEAEQTVLVYGPPRHIELVATVLDTLEQTSKERVGNVVRVIPLKYASAADRLSGSTQISGLASMLNSIFAANAGGVGNVDSSRNSPSSVVGSSAKRRAAESTYGLKQGGESGGGGGAAPGKGAAGMPSTWRDRIQLEEPTGLTGSKSSVVDDRPFFQADEATNSIIIKALPERMRQYEALVHQLDVAQDMVEIEASIIDVSTDEFESLGIEWDYTRSGQGRVTVSPGEAGGGSSGLTTALAGANITTLVGDAGRQLLTRIRALEGTGKARILARPKVLGSANRTATMTNKRVASVKVAGNLDANLFTVEAGTTMQVQPQIITYPDRREVKLTLFIEDGNFEAAAVDQVPIVKRTEIRTEAVIREGESLLIGGISIETDSNGRSGLPGLSRIPLLGALFRHDEGSKHRSERLFLLTPKVLNVEGAKAPYAYNSQPTPAIPQVGTRTNMNLNISESLRLPKPAKKEPAYNDTSTPKTPGRTDCAQSRALGFSDAACAV